MTEQNGSFFVDSVSCSYLPEQQSRLEYRFVATLTADEYCELVNLGWRRFGHLLFRPRCVGCVGCRSLRVVAADFRPNRSQGRVLKSNLDLEISISRPEFDAERLRLYGEFHDVRSQQKGWPREREADFDHYLESFMIGPLPILEIAYRLEGKLLGIGLFDELPDGLSAIYCFYAPEAQKRGLGTFNVLTGVRETQRRGLPFLHLGYFVVGCSSLEYKANFMPHQILDHQTAQWSAAIVR